MTQDSRSPLSDLENEIDATERVVNASRARVVELETQLKALVTETTAAKDPNQFLGNPGLDQTNKVRPGDFEAIAGFAFGSVSAAALAGRIAVRGWRDSAHGGSYRVAGAAEYLGFDDLSHESCNSLDSKSECRPLSHQHPTSIVFLPVG